MPDSGEACTPETQLRSLLSYNNLPNPFNDTETTQLINAIDVCKILDPACGSGAFPMGILHKLVHCLHKLDPDNKQWQALQRAKILQDTQAAMSIEDNKELSDKLKELNNTFDKNVNHPDYARKLFLIENCIYSVSIFNPLRYKSANFGFLYRWSSIKLSIPIKRISASCPCLIWKPNLSPPIR